MNRDLPCRSIKCPDYNTDDGEPAWCYRAGCPATVAANKCPKVSGEQNGRNTDGKAKSTTLEKIHASISEL